MVITEVSETENDSSCEQAEVRLVVKFIVEEQIFFRGKILDRTPLESEEISRIVSKIALSETQLAGYKKASTAFKAEKSTETSNTPTVPTVEIIKNTIVAQDDLKPTEPVPCPDLSSQKEEILPPLTNQQPQSPLTDSLDAKELPDNSEDNTMTIQEESDMGPSSIGCIEEKTCLALVPPERLSTNDNCDTLSSAKTTSDNPKTFSLSSPRSEVLKEDNSDIEIHPESSIDVEDTSKSQIIHNYVNQPPPECAANIELAGSLQEKGSIEVNDNEEKSESCGDTSDGAEFNAKPDSLVEKIDNSETNCVKLVSPDVPNQDKSCSDEIIDQAHMSGKKKSIKRSPKSKPERSSSISTSSKDCNHRQQSTNTKRLRQSNQKSANTSPQQSAKLMSNQVSAMTSNTVSTDSLLQESQVTRTNNSKVFAKWTDLHFYPGTVQKPTGDKKYIVNFCDGGTKALTVIDLIPVVNVNKKNVRVAISKNLCVNAIVHGQHSQNQGSLMFDVEYNQGGNLVRRNVPFKDIFLTPEQGSPLVDQPDKVPGASNFADVDLDNIIFEKRPRRFQEMDNYLPDKLPIKRRRRHLSRSPIPRSSSLELETQLEEKNQLMSSDLDHSNQSEISISKMEVDKKHCDIDVASPPTTTSNSSNSSSSSNVPPLELRHEIYFSGSTHRTKTSLLL